MEPILTQEKKQELIKQWKKFPEVNEHCIGCWVCVYIAPKVFMLNKEGVSVVKEQEAYETPEVKEAIDSCPVHAIQWVQ